jgi:excinuclease UvrABC nuclease subunit
MQIKWSNLYDLDSGSIQKYTPNSAGVYVLWVKKKDGRKRVFYVGQARNLEERLLVHVSDDESNDCIKGKASDKICYYQTAEIATQNERDGIETFLYGEYNPKCNDIAPPGDKSIEVNLP